MPLSNDDLKLWLQRDGLRRIDKLLVVLASSETPISVADIKAKAVGAGCAAQYWNVTDIFNRSKGLTLRVPGGYELAEKGKVHLQTLGIGEFSPAAYKVATDLRKHLENLKDADTRAFVDEAIKCYEARLFRSAVVMSWLAAIDVLKKAIVSDRLKEFNAEVRRINPKWKDAQNADDIGLLKESDFLDRLVGISFMGKNRKQRLEQALTLRNGCGHPNSLKIGQNEVTAHIEALLQNVFEVY